MKLLKRPTMLKAEEPAKKEEKKTKKSSKNNLPADTYVDEFEPLELPIDDTRKFIISVKRGGEMGLPMCDVRQYQTTEVYTGFTKKGINFPIEYLPDLFEILQEAYNKCVEKNLL